MEQNAKIVSADLAALRVIRYPDPRLMEICTALDVVDDSLRAFVERMGELMFTGRGVGLAAPQVGVTVRLFVASPTFTPEDRRVYINPRIVSAEGKQDGDEGCLSFPEITCRVKRHETVTIRAQDLAGRWFEETASELTARIFEHEMDHLDGRLLVDRMGTVAKLANRRALNELREKYEEAN